MQRLLIVSIGCMDPMRFDVVLDDPVQKILDCQVRFFVPGVPGDGLTKHTQAGEYMITLSTHYMWRADPWSCMIAKIWLVNGAIRAAVLLGFEL